MLRIVVPHDLIYSVIIGGYDTVAVAYNGIGDGISGIVADQSVKGNPLIGGNLRRIVLTGILVRQGQFGNHRIVAAAGCHDRRAAEHDRHPG